MWRFLAVVTAKVKAPMMIDKSNVHKLTFIANKGEYSELSISTIEKAESTEWIAGLQVAQPELLRLTKKTSTCEPYVAAGLCKRVYRFGFELLQQKPISRNIALNFEYSHDATLVANPAVVLLEVLPDVSSIPQQLNFDKVNSSTRTQTLLVLDRKANSTSEISINKFARDLVRIERIYASARVGYAKFCIELLPDVTFPTLDSEIVFGLAENRELVVPLKFGAR